MKTMWSLSQPDPSLNPGLPHTSSMPSVIEPLWILAKGVIFPVSYSPCFPNHSYTGGKWYHQIVPKNTLSTLFALYSVELTDRFRVPPVISDLLSSPVNHACVQSLFRSAETCATFSPSLWLLLSCLFLFKLLCQCHFGLSSSHRYFRKTDL